MKPEPDEIDEIVAGELRMMGLGLNEKDSLFLASRIRMALRGRGFAIVLDEAQLLEKGGEVKPHE